MGKIIKLPIKRKLNITPPNTIVAGDCYEWLDSVPENSVDICYIDPPFFSNRNYEIIWGNGYELRSFGDRWKGGIEVYIDWMKDRVQKIHKTLKTTGSLFLHCDWHANHRLRVMLDEVFGEKNFINEVIWAYRTGGNNPKKNFSRKHDTILWYSKGEKFTFNNNIEKEQVELTHKYGFSTIKVFEEEIKTCTSDKKCKRFYKEISLRDVWEISALVGKEKGSDKNKERIGYKTQKPEKLLKRIILSSTNENDVVLDCFGGGGTTASVCAQTNRKFITGDVSPVAVRIISERLKNLPHPPHFNILGTPRTKEDWLNVKGKDFSKKICEFMGWEWTDGTGDSGIDAWANNKTIPIQIKNHKNKVGETHIRNFIGSMRGIQKGLFVAWELSPSAHEYLIIAKKDYKKDIEFLPINNILKGILISYDKKLELEELYKKIG